MRFKKKDIENYILSEGKEFKLYKKRSLSLKEDNTKGSAFVNPTTDNGSSMASDLDKSISKNPNAKEYVTNGDNLDSNSTNQNTNVDIDGSNGQEMKNNAQKYLNSTQGKKLGADNITFHFRKESKDYANFTKKSLNEFLKKL